MPFALSGISAFAAPQWRRLKRYGKNIFQCEEGWGIGVANLSFVGDIYSSDEVMAVLADGKGPCGGLKI
jgi:hypothetical protein